MKLNTQIRKRNSETGKIMLIIKIVASTFLLILILGLYLGYQNGLRNSNYHLKEFGRSLGESVGLLANKNENFLNKVVITTPTEYKDDKEQVGENRIFNFKNRYFSMEFKYPNYPSYAVSHWEDNNLRKTSVSVQFRLSNVNSNKKFLSLYVLDKNNCLYGWCWLKAKETFETPNFLWEYLGSASYYDVGELSIYKNLYRTQKGDFSVYAVTEEPVNLVNNDNVSSVVFKTLLLGDEN